MPQATRTFRIFVSSTFNDLKEERNALQEQVFPRLRELCMQHDTRFQAIDLRWGVSEEAGQDQQTMKICLGEIERCQKTTPRPNFIVLLGDRYGWRPLPAEIPVQEFEKLLRRLPTDKLKQWYKRDDNVLSPVYCLLPRQGELQDFDKWQLVEHELRAMLLEAGKQMPPEQRWKYIASATEQEIARGALQIADAPQQVFCFFRTINDLPHNLESPQDFVDLDTAHNVDNEAHTQLKRLKNALRLGLSSNVHEYEARWTGSSITTDHIGQLYAPIEVNDQLAQDMPQPDRQGQAVPNLCQDVYDSLARVIRQELTQLKDEDSWTREIRYHKEFGQDRAHPKFFTGRTAILQTIAEYLQGANRYPMAVFGVSGAGKSALLARAVAEAQSHHSEAEIVFRFIGATPASSNGRALLESLCHQISRAYGDETTVPTTYLELLQDFPKRLKLASRDKPLFLFLDALDQLSDVDNARNLSWLPLPVDPTKLPEHVRIVVSTLPEPHPCLPVLRSHPALPGSHLVELGAMPRQEGEELLDCWLQEAGRKLQPEQQAKVLRGFEQGGLPLYLRFAFEEACLWHSYDGTPDLADDIPHIIENLFARLSRPANHGKLLVQRALGYIAAAKNGLSEDELLDVLSADKEVMSDFRQRSPKSPNVERLPVVIWSRLYYDTAPYLNERSADGTSLLAFFHRQLRDVVTEEYLTGEMVREHHRALAVYFAERPHQIERDGCQTLNFRKLSELPYQQREGEMWSELEYTLCDLSFIEAKCTAGMVYDLIADYNAALVAQDMPPDTQRRIAEFAHFLETQSHVLARCPALTFQQALNEPDATAPAQAAHQRVQTGQETRPHMRWLNKPQLVSRRLMTIVGHSDIINSCAISPDGTRIVSASSDRTLKIWDMADGKELLTLRGHIDSVETCAFAPDGSHIVSGARDGEVKIWDAVSGQEVARLAGHKDAPVASCTFAPSGKQVVSASWDHTLKVWEASTGEELYTLHGHDSPVFTCAFSPDGSRIVSGADDGSLKLWDTHNGTELEPLAGHAKGVMACAFSADGTWIVSASEDGTLRRWDATTRALLTTYSGHVKPVRAVAISSDEATLVSSAEDGSLMLWEVMTGRTLARLTGHTDEVWGLAFFPKQPRVVSASWDLTLKLWDVTTVAGAPEHMLPVQESTSATPATGEVSEYPMITCSCSPDGTRFVAGSADGSLRLWDATTGSALGTFAVHQNYVTICTFSPDGRWIVSGAWDGSLQLFDAVEQRQGPTLPGHERQIRLCTFSRDGTRMVSCSADKIQVWNMNLPDIQRRCVWQAEEGKPFEACTATPDGQQIIAGFADGEIIVWDITAERPVASFADRHEGFRYCALSPNGTHLVSASSDGTLKVWDVASGAELTTLLGHTDRVEACNFSPDGRRVVSASWDNTLKVWEIANPAEPRTLIGHTGQLQDGCFSPDGRRVLSAGMDRTVRLWDADTGSPLGCLVSPPNSVTSCAFSPDGTRIASGSHRWALQLWDGADGTVQRILHGHVGDVRACAFAPDGTRLLSASADQTLKVWDVATGTELVTLTGHRGPVQTCAFSPDGRHIASGAWDNTVRLWHAETGAPLATLTGHDGWVQLVLFSADGSRLVSCAQDRTIRVWEVASGALLSTLVGHQDVVMTCAFSRDGLLVSGSRDKTLKIWDIPTGRELFTLTGHNEAICFCGFSPDGLHIVSASMDKTLKLWDVHTGQPQYTLSGHKGWVLACAFSPDGKRVLSGAADGVLKLWDTATGKEMCEYWAGAAVQAGVWHPQRARCAVGDSVGQLHLLQLEPSSLLNS